MEHFQIKLSDILKYIVLGLTEVVIVFFVFFYPLDYSKTREATKDTQQIENQDSRQSKGVEILTDKHEGNGAHNKLIDLDGYRTIIITVIPIATLAFLYLLGYITQCIILLILGGRFLGTGITEIAEYIRYHPRLLLQGDKYPNWIHWSDNPGKVISSYIELLEATDDYENKLKFLYINQLLQGVCLTLALATPFSCFPEGCNKIIIGYYIGFGLIVAAIIASNSSFLGLIKLSPQKISIIPYFFLIAILAIQLIGCLCFEGGDEGKLNLIWPTCLLVSSILAIQLSKRQINRLGILSKDTDDLTFDNIICRYGLPKAYILVRAHQTKYLEEALDSIARQDYNNIKVIILIDNKSSNKGKIEIAKIANKYSSHSNLHPNKKPLNIICSISRKSGPAATAYEIREIYLKYANDDDIAIMLDSDDKFYSPTVVSNIMTKMYRSKSDVCVLSFEVFGMTSLDFSSNAHNDYVKKIASKKNAWSPEELNKEIGTYHISTIGWTKCYKKHLIKFYQDRLKEHYKNNNGEPYEGCTKYEDFPDIVMLLKRGIRICALEKNAILFRKRDNSTTTDIKWTNYSENIPYFLRLCIKIADSAKDELIEGGEETIKMKLVPYKVIQYYNILAIDERVKHELSEQKISDASLEFMNKIITFMNEIEISENIKNFLNHKDINKDLEIFDTSKSEKHFDNLIS